MHGRSTAFRACKSSYFDFLIFGVSAFCLLTKPLFSLHFLEAKEENLIHSNQICTPRPVFVSQLKDVSDNHSTNLMSRADYGIVNRSLYVLKKSCFRYSTLQGCVEGASYMYVLWLLGTQIFLSLSALSLATCALSHFICM